MPGTTSSASPAAAIAGATPSTESWSVIASAARPRSRANATSSSGESAPSLKCV